MQIVVAFTKPGSETDAVLIAESKGPDNINITKNRLGHIIGPVPLGVLLVEITKAVERGK